MAEIDSAYMRRALVLARLGWGQTAPNPMVGAVVVVGGAIVGEGYHARFGEAHAEVMALAESGARARGATVYVTLEPCAHHGKTPPCAEALIAAGVARVVVAVRDPSVLARGGADYLRAAGIAVDVGLEGAAALELNTPFFNAQYGDLPWVTVKLALSAEGAIADATRRQRWITGEDARREVHRFRANVDAIAIGVGTVLADDPSLTARDARPPRVPTRRIVFDASLRTPLGSQLVRTARELPVIVVARAADPSRRAALEDAGVEVVEAPTTRDALVRLRALGIRSLFVEGGAALAGGLLTEDLVDRLIIFQAPLALGPGALAAFGSAPANFAASLERVRVVGRRAFGDDVMTTYALHDIPCSPD